MDMVKTYKKKQTRRRQRQRRQRASVRRIRKIQRGGEPDTDTDAFVKSIQLPSFLADVTLSVEEVSTKPDRFIPDSPKTSVTKTKNNKKIEFFIVAPNPLSNLQSVYIYINENLHGRVMITVGESNHGSYDSETASAIFLAIKNKPI